MKRLRRIDRAKYAQVKEIIARGRRSGDVVRISGLSDSTVRRIKRSDNYDDFKEAARMLMVKYGREQSIVTKKNKRGREYKVTPENYLQIKRDIDRGLPFNLISKYYELSEKTIGTINSFRTYDEYRNAVTQRMCMVRNVVDEPAKENTQVVAECIGAIVRLSQEINIVLRDQGAMAVTIASVRNEILAMKDILEKQNTYFFGGQNNGGNTNG